MDQHLKRTPLFHTHLSLKARMVPFAGWEMPVQFTSILAEARAVRRKAGLFDVSHMGRLYLTGPEAPALMDWLFTADAMSLKVGRARYGLVCNEKGGIIDDGIFYRLGEEEYLWVCNAANRERVVAWTLRWIGERFAGVRLEDRTEETALIALQGPAAAEMLDSVSRDKPSEMRPFSGKQVDTSGVMTFIGRTGYTGEDGFELVVPGEKCTALWNSLLERGAVPCGLGARDVLRLEAALPLHGNDIDSTTTPLEACLERFVRLGKEFVGVEALRKQARDGVSRRLVGLVLEGRHIPRKGYPIQDQGESVGQVTSGTYSPILDRNIALGYVSTGRAKPGTNLQVSVRGSPTPAQVVVLPFYNRKRD